MAEKAKKNNKNLIIGICTAVLVIVVIIVAVVFATKGSTQLNDAYFVSDGTKYVLTLDGDTLSLEGLEYTPTKAHIVYKYSGDNVTDMTSYIEFTDEATAKAALPTYQEIYTVSDESGIKSVSTNGKYIVVVATEDQYADMTASDVKQQIELMEMLQSGDYNLDETEDTVVENEK